MNGHMHMVTVDYTTVLVNIEHIEKKQYIVMIILDENGVFGCLLFNHDS